MLRRIIWLVLWAVGMAAVVTKAGTPSKAKAVEKRMDRAVAALTAANGNLEDLIATLQGLATSTNGLTNGTINGRSDTAGLANGTINGTTGGASAGTAHTHGSGTLAVADGTHHHGASSSDGNMAVADGTHHHALPNPL